MKKNDVYNTFSKLRDKESSTYRDYLQILGQDNFILIDNLIRYLEHREKLMLYSLEYVKSIGKVVMDVPVDSIFDYQGCPYPIDRFWSIKVRKKKSSHNSHS